VWRTPAPSRGISSAVSTRPVLKATALTAAGARSCFRLSLALATKHCCLQRCQGKSNADQQSRTRQAARCVSSTFCWLPRNVLKRAAASGIERRRRGKIFRPKEDAERDHAAAESSSLETTPTVIPFAPRLRTAASVPLAEADAKSAESFWLKYDILSKVREITDISIISRRWGTCRLRRKCGSHAQASMLSLCQRSRPGLWLSHSLILKRKPTSRERT
jgi:hypothetical protein